MENPLEKRRRLNESCAICEQTLDEKSVDDPFIRNPTLDGVKAVLQAAEIRQDTVHDRFLKIKDGILNQTEFPLNNGGETYLNTDLPA